ncbi:hypothetical protein KIPB_008496, partial [Kipferlia bialata]
ECQAGYDEDTYVSWCPTANAQAINYSYMLAPAFRKDWDDTYTRDSDVDWTSRRYLYIGCGAGAIALVQLTLQCILFRRERKSRAARKNISPSPTQLASPVASVPSMRSNPLAGRRR